MIERRKVKPLKFDTPSGDGFLHLDPVDLPKNDKSKNNNQTQDTMFTSIGRFLLRIIKPRRLLGKLTGALSSLVAIPALGSAGELDLTLIAITTIVFVFGYLFSFSLEQIKETIKFLNSLTDKVDKKKA